MRSVQLELTIPHRDSADVYATLADFARYPEFSPAVRSVTVTRASELVTISEWEVSFRRGLLHWVEEDSFDSEARRIDFRQLQGDLALFDGSWDCADIEGGTRITFRARLDLGIPSLADALEPIAERILVDNTAAIVSGLFQGTARREGVEADAPNQGLPPKEPSPAEGNHVELGAVTP